MPSAPSYRASLADTLALLQEIEQRHAPAALSNGFGPESMILTDLIARHNLAIDIFSLDTGRLPPETYHLAQLARRRYGLTIHLFTPKPEELEPWLAAHGPDAFYESVERRHECCAIRKVFSLNRALAGRKAWLTGLRREQSAHRSDLEAREWDAAHQMHKFNPMVHWTHREVWDYIRDFDVPHNALHKRGYASIGCAPCTRAITAGEDIRAGRWWWEQDDLKECGLHVQQTVNTSNSSKTTPARPAGVSPRGATDQSSGPKPSPLHLPPLGRSTMKILILGGDGFCGWPTALHLSNLGHDVAIVDNLSRREIDIELECDSLTPIRPMGEGLRA